MKIRNAMTLLAVCCLFSSTSALALGLGDARVESFIGQPLELRIDLRTSPSDDLDSVTARLATAEDFSRIGASREAISMPLFFSVRERDSGDDAYIMVTSRQAIHDPVLRLVVELNWASGRLLREYTVFLDPPTLPARAPLPAAARSELQEEATGEPAPAAARQAETAPQPAAEADVSAPPPAVAAETDTEAAAARESSRDTSAPEGGAYGPVRSGETLWRIASNHVGASGMDVNQTMLAIQRRNPEAFLNDNINLLKRGAQLEMPTADEVNEVSPERARELVAQQEAAFRMRGSLASASTPLLAAESRVDAAEPAPAGADEGVEETPVSRLEIVPTSEEELSAGQPGTGTVPAGEGAEEMERDLREELARTEEELFSERQQNEYLRERISELEAQLSESGSETAVQMPDDELATLEDRLQEERLADAQAAEEPPAAEEPEVREPNAMPAVTSAPAEADEPWYSGAMIWIIMVVIVLAGVIGWILNRRRAVEYDLSAMAGGGTVATGLRGDAEEILRTLDSDGQEDASDERRSMAEPESDRYAAEIVDEEEEGFHAPPVVPLESARRSRAEDTADARVLDENSSDPEIKLDLARAYISMGDKEAARVILEEVLSVGSDAQQSEARSMMNEM